MKSGTKIADVKFVRCCRDGPATNIPDKIKSAGIFSGARLCDMTSATTNNFLSRKNNGLIKPKILFCQFGCCRLYHGRTPILPVSPGTDPCRLPTTRICSRTCVSFYRTLINGGQNRIPPHSGPQNNFHQLTVGKYGSMTYTRQATRQLRRV